ncbi:MAG: hypothetical protein ACRC2T_08860 [Thermoguttaceae bacterium]
MTFPFGNARFESKIFFFQPASRVMQEECPSKKRFQGQILAII